MTQYLITFPSDAMNHIPDSKRQSARPGMRMTWSAPMCLSRCRSRRVESPVSLEDSEVAFGVQAVQPLLVDDRA
jgi:hypothetical protein